MVATSPHAKGYVVSLDFWSLFLSGSQGEFVELCSLSSRMLKTVYLWLYCWSLVSILSYSTCYRDKISNKSDLRKGVYFGSLVCGIAHHSREGLAAGAGSCSVTCFCSGSRERWMLVFSLLSPFYGVKDLCPWHGTMLPRCRVTLPTPVKLI